ncbi:MAG: acyl-CoA dehydrogenase [Candidatus Promineifilaceae bacterium]|jgi:acyl-CoA dehydrogenase
MIDFTIPPQIAQNIEKYKIIAVEVMRPVARQLDEAEHERPTDYFNAMWPFVKAQYSDRIEAIKNGNDNATPDGPNWALLENILMIEALSWGDAGQYLGRPTPSLGGAAIDAIGTDAQKLHFYQRWTEDPPKWGSMAITEPGAGSDNSSMRTTAVLDPDTNEWILNGEKVFITNGKLALDESHGLSVVWATIDPKAGRAGIKSFVVEGGNPGVIIAKQEHKLGIRASDTVSLVFQDCRIPYENLLGSADVVSKSTGNKGFKGAMQTFNASRPAVAAGAIGVARAALEFTQETLAAEGITVDYRKPKNQLTAIERDLIEMEARYTGAKLLVMKAVAMMVYGNNNRLEASQCKYRAGESVTWITQKSVELLGPMGYSRELLAEKFMRDAKINDIYEGTRQINLLIIARVILGYSRRELA